MSPVKVNTFIWFGDIVQMVYKPLVNLPVLRVSSATTKVDLV